MKYINEKRENYSIELKFLNVLKGQVKKQEDDMYDKFIDTYGSRLVESLPFDRHSKVRCSNALKRAGFKTIKDVLDGDIMLRFPGIGYKTWMDIENAIKDLAGYNIYEWSRCHYNKKKGK